MCGILRSSRRGSWKCHINLQRNFYFFPSSHSWTHHAHDCRRRRQRNVPIMYTSHIWIMRFMPLARFCCGTRAADVDDVTPPPCLAGPEGLPVQTSRLLPLLNADMTARVWMLTLRADSKRQPNAKQTKAKNKQRVRIAFSVMSSRVTAPHSLWASVVGLLACCDAGTWSGWEAGINLQQTTQPLPHSCINFIKKKTPSCLNHNKNRIHNCANQAKHSIRITLFNYNELHWQVTQLLCFLIDVDTLLSWIPIQWNVAAQVQLSGCSVFCFFLYKGIITQFRWDSWGISGEGWLMAESHPAMGVTWWQKIIFQKEQQQR